MKNYQMKKNNTVKKLIACFLTICLLVGSMGWLNTAFAACLHSNTRVDESEPVYTPNGAVVHTVKITHSTVCNDCGETLRTWDTTRSDSHVWDPTDSYCTLCQWERPAPACGHTATSRSFDHEEFPKYDDIYHQHIRYYNIVCDSCGATVDTEKETDYDMHSFDGNGKCEFCNYQQEQACSHTSTRKVYDDDKTVYENINDSSVHLTHYWYDAVCKECGETVQTNLTITEEEEHSFNNEGICTDCGYKKQYEELQVSLSVSPATVEVGGKFTATATVSGGVGDVNLYWYVTCKENIIYDTSAASSIIDIPTEEAGAGDYVVQVTAWDANGTQCVATKTVTATAAVCTHEHKEPAYTEPEYEQIEGNETEHNVYKYYDLVCSDCGETVLTHQCDGPENEAHHFDDNGKCSDCGYIKAVNQEELQVSVTANQSSAKVGDTISANATATGGVGNYLYGWKVSRNGAVLNETDMGRGDYYDYTADAEGSYTFTAYVRDGNGTQVSGNSVAIVVEAATVVEELQVSLSVSPAMVEVGGQFAATATVSGGVGDVNLHWYVTCRENIIYDTSAASSIIDIPANEAGDYVIQVTAWDANGTQRVETKTVTATAAVCTHENKEPAYTEPEYEQIEGNETEHNVYKYYDLVCSDCGETVLTRQCDGPEKEAHHFDGNGKCSDCGYIKAVNQEELQVSLSVSPATVEVGGQFTATVTVSGGVGDVNLYWYVTCKEYIIYDTSAASSIIDIPTEEAGAGDYVVQVTAWDANGTKRVATKTVTATAAVCTHEHKKPAYTEPEYEQIEGNETEHNVYKYYDLVCSDCGEILEAHKCDEPEKEVHEYDESGKCIKCGYAKEILDGELRAAVVIDKTVARVGDNLEASATASGGDGNYSFAWKIIRDDEEIYSTPLGIGPKYQYLAEEAGTYVFTVIVRDGRGVLASADGDPILVIDCQHEHTNEPELETLGYTNNGDDGHTRTVKVRVVCADCGTVLEEEAIRDKPEHHDFTNGPCICGQSNHVHEYEDVEIPGKRSNYVNETTEVHSVTITYVERCKGCGDQSEEKTKVITEAHNYSSKGHIEKEPHIDGLGHRLFDRCACGATKYTGSYAQLSGCCDCYGHMWGNVYESKGKWYHQCRRCNIIESTKVECPLFGIHQWNLKYREPHPHKAYWYCDCGQEKEMLHSVQTNLTNCCTCVGHSWGNPVKMSDGSYQCECIRCHTVETLNPSSYLTAFDDVAGIMNEIYNKSGVLSIWRKIALESTDHLTDYWGFVVSAESLKKFSSMFNTLWNNMEGQMEISVDGCLLTSPFIPLTVRMSVGKNMMGEIKALGVQDRDFEAIKEATWETVIISMLNKDASERSSEVDFNGVLDFGSQETGIVGDVAGELEDLFMNKAIKYGDELTEFVTKNEALYEKIKFTDPETYKKLFLDKQTALESQQEAFMEHSSDMNKAGKALQAFGYLMDALNVVGVGAQSEAEVKKLNESFTNLLVSYSENMRKLDEIIAVAKAEGNTPLIKAAENVRTRLIDEKNDNIEQYLSETEAFWYAVAEKGAETIAKDGIELVAKAELLPLKIIEFGASIINMHTGLGKEYDLSLELMTLGTMNAEMDILGLLNSHNSEVMVSLWSELQVMGCNKAIELVKHDDEHNDFMRGIEKEIGLSESLESALGTEKNMYIKYIK